jgi:sulfate transport system substrate-binding protein
MNRRHFLTAAAGTAGAAWLGTAGYVLFGRGGGRQLLNASYDATRELYRHVNRMFAERTEVRARPSHGGSGSQARAVIDGLPADVVTLAIRPDVDAIARKELIHPGWDRRFPDPTNPYPPYTSTIVFVVRRGNPYGVKDWDDLPRLPAGASVVTANPKTSGAAKLGLLACWGAVTTRGGSDREAEDQVRAVFGKVKSLESSSRAATVTFARKGQGAVHITWENEARLEAEEAKGELEVVYPSRSILAAPPVAVVDANVARNGTADLAAEYLRFLYDPVAQDVIAGEFYRPATPQAAAKHTARFPDLTRFDVDPVFGGWDEAQKRFFADGGVFDRVYTSG